MKNATKKTISVAVASAMILSMSGCSLFDKSKDEVLEAVDSYAKNLASCNVGKIAKGTVEDFEDDQDEWDDRLAFSENDWYETSDAASAAGAIADTISYEVDEESVEASKKSGEGSVNVVFTIADYESVLDEELTDVDEFIDAVGDADTTEIEITIEFEKVDDEWLCSNYDEIFEDLYAFTDEEYSFAPALADLILGVNWYGCDYNLGEGYYTNTTYIDADLSFDWSATDDIDYSGIYYTVEYQGNEVYRQSGTYMGYLYTDYSGAPVDPSGYLAAGEYTITFYDENDAVLWTGNAIVSVEEVEAVIEDELDWWFLDDGDDHNPIYINTDVIDGELEFTGYDYSSGYYTIEYNGEVIYQEYGEYDAWVYLSEIDNPPTDPSGMYYAAGEYTITFYDAEGNVLVSDTCTVVVE